MKWLANININTFSIAPYMAGSPPALVMGISLYKAIMASVGVEWQALAGLVGLMGVIGMLTVEKSIYESLARAFAEKQWGALKVAAAGALIVTGMFIYTVYSGNDTRPLISTSIATLVGWCALILKKYLDTVQEKQTEQLTAETVRTDNQAKILKLEADIERQKANTARAEARKAKASGGQSSGASGGQSSGASGLSGGQEPVSGGQAGQGQCNPDILAKVVDYLRQQERPEAVTVRQLAEAKLGVGKSQMVYYKAEALKRLAVEAG